MKSCLFKCQCHIYLIVSSSLELVEVRIRDHEVLA